MANVFIEPRPKGRPEGSAIDDYVVEDHANHVFKTCKTQKEAIDWAKKEGHHPLVARVGISTTRKCRISGGLRSVMAGLAPAIHVSFNAAMKGGWFYLMTNRRNGILYAGVTSNLPRRAFEHRQGLIRGFTKRYGLKTLVYCEQYDFRSAIQRERTLKHWPRAWKVRLIQAENPEWKDLYDGLI